jgi:hypothetical protein
MRQSFLKLNIPNHFSNWDIFKIIFRTKQNNTYIYSHQNENPNTYNHGKSQDAKKTAKKSLLKRQKKERQKREKKTVQRD